jgi:hypothetical protein
VPLEIDFRRVFGDVSTKVVKVKVKQRPRAAAVTVKAVASSHARAIDIHDTSTLPLAHEAMFAFHYQIA